MNFRQFVEQRAQFNLTVLAATIETRLHHLKYFSDDQYNESHKDSPDMKGVHGVIELRMQPPGMNRALFMRSLWVPGVPECPIEEERLEGCESALRDGALALNHFMIEQLRRPYSYPLYDTKVTGDQLIEVIVRFPDIPQVTDLGVCLRQSLTFEEAIPNEEWREEEYEKLPEQGEGG